MATKHNCRRIQRRIWSLPCCYLLLVVLALAKTRKALKNCALLKTRLLRSSKTPSACGPDQSGAGIRNGNKPRRVSYRVLELITMDIKKSHTRFPFITVVIKKNKIPGLMHICAYRKIKFRVVIYIFTVLNFFDKGKELPVLKPSGLCRFFPETQRFFELALNTQNQLFLLASGFFQIPGLSGSSILEIFSITQNPMGITKTRCPGPVFGSHLRFSITTGSGY
jgi:hypothetical protein